MPCFSNSCSDAARGAEAGAATTMVSESRSGSPRRKVPPHWDLKQVFLQKVGTAGGFVNCHAHFDKSYLISEDYLQESHASMEAKWDLYRHFKAQYTRNGLIRRISRAADAMISQGIKHCRTHIDVDATVKLLPLEAALEVKAAYADRISVQVVAHPLHGLQDPDDRRWFKRGCELADVVGGLPSRDRPFAGEHLDILFDLARKQEKPLDVHVDQENNPDEKDTSLLAAKTLAHRYEGMVTAIHAVSLAALELKDQEEVFALMRKARMNVTVCPSAALSMKPLPKMSLIHNSMAPVPKLLLSGINVSLGCDNIHDLFMPYCDGDMWVEARMLMEACRFYFLDEVVKICTANGRKTLLGWMLPR